MNNNIIAERLKKAREKKDLTQQQLATLLNVAKSVISGAETKRGISKSLATKLAKYFNTNVEYWINPNAEEEAIKLHNGLETLDIALDRLIEEGLIKKPDDIRKDKEIMDIILKGVELEIEIKLKKKQG